MQERDKMMRQVMIYDFALKDASMYLDSHPDCQNGLEFYRKYKKLSKDAHEAYTKKFGPIVQMEAANTDRWTWTDDPWPWERSI